MIFAFMTYIYIISNVLNILGCSKCHKVFLREGFGSRADFSGYDESTWTKRTREEHLAISELHVAASTKTKQKNLEYEHRVRYTELIRLFYYNPIRCDLVDPMHCLLLGVGKHTLKAWIEVSIFVYI